VLNETTPKVGLVSVSYPNFLDWRAQSRAFSQMAAVCGVGFNLAADPPENVGGAAVSSDLLSMLGVRPVLGRDFEASEDQAGAAPVLLLSYRFWQSHFGGQQNVVGRSLSLDDRSFTIVGVLPPDFRLIETADVVEPIGVWATTEPGAKYRGQRGDTIVIARMAQGVALPQARAEMEGIAARLAKAYPAENDRFGVALRPIRDVLAGDLRPAILALFAAVVFVLLIACANVANLFLLRGAGRGREVALRIAVGAGGGRIIRQFLTESFVLAALGGLLGSACAFWGIRGVARLLPHSLSGETFSLNGAVLLFVVALVAMCALLFGLAPSLRAARVDVQSGLKESGRNTSGGLGQGRLRETLAIAEISLALILLIGTGLMIKTLSRLLSVDPGFRPERLVTMKMGLRTAKYAADPAILNFWDSVLDTVRALPGAKAAALGTVVPFTNDHSRTDITLENMELPAPGAFPHPDVHIVSPAYLSTLGLRLERGRAFTDADNRDGPRVAMINAMVAQRFFAGEDPIGKRFIFGHPSQEKPPQWVTIVGVVGDTRLYGLADPARFEVYVPFRQSVSDEMSLIVRSERDPTALISVLRSAVATVDKQQPVFDAAAMEELIGRSVETRRTTLILLGLFGGLALALAAVGVYGVISYSVAQRSHEIGIRIALGAQRGGVLGMILGRGAKIAGAGALIGVAASLGVTRFMASLLFSVGANDPFIFAAAAAVMALVAMLACYIPARRALRVDPIVALRHE
jgi:putative ABC transport system permease protein